jgi:alpha-tubulin suppressor-like RCC1 family protein
MKLAPAVFTAVFGALGVAGCGNVAEVLTAAAGGDSSSGGGAGGGAPAAGQANSGGAQPENPALGVFIDSGDAHACAARFGVLYCWGENADGRLGLGDETDRGAPERVGDAADWISVATGVAHTCALKADGSVWCFGANNFGQLGLGSSAPSRVPLPVSLPGKVLHLSSQANTACAVLESGALYCWGRNWEGNIGLNDQHPGVDQPSPVRSGSDSDWLVTGTGDGHTCGIREPGLLLAWGRNSAANLGLGQTVDEQRRVATPVGSEQDWLSVVSGQDASCGIRSSGLLFCWGGNGYATLGLGDRDQRLTPTQVMAPAGSGAWTEVSLDTFHACGIDADNRLYCWGRNSEGQLGTGDNDDRLVPTPINVTASASGVRQVVVGRFSSCAVSSGAGDRVYCTGENNAGQLGLAEGDAVRRNAFTEVAFP